MRPYGVQHFKVSPFNPNIFIADYSNYELKHKTPKMNLNFALRMEVQGGRDKLCFLIWLDSRQPGPLGNALPRSISAVLHSTFHDQTYTLALLLIKEREFIIL